MLKKIISLTVGLFAGCTSMLFASPEMPETPSGFLRIDPPCWWVGMKDPSLQLMVSAPGIAKADFRVDYPGVTLDSQTQFDSPDYKFLYLTVSSEARPGSVKLEYSLGGKKYTVPYQLMARDRAAADYKGFDAGDVLYLLMPDRFAKGLDEKQINLEGMDYPVTPDRTDPNGRHGGDMRGIRQHLDYIDSLGVTAIWVCPVLENDMPGGSYHGYATTDYYRMDPRFGSNAEWCALVDDAHSRGLKVVMDMIFNHSGSNHPWMKNLPSSDWFNHPDAEVMTNHRLTTAHDPYASEYDRDRAVNGWFVPSMPDLNQRNPHLMRYLIQNSIWWIETSKIDGIRMDTYPYADPDGMASWCAALLNEYPEFNIVGECWYAKEPGTAFWQSGSPVNPKDSKLPTVMDFFHVLNGRQAFSETTMPWGTSGLNALYDHLAQDFLYADPQRVLTFLDNHDTDRFLAEVPENLDNWKQAITFLLTSRGIPQIYYGTELLMNGSKEGSDGYVRLDMPGGFPGDETDAFTAAGRTPLQNEAWDYMSKLLHWRRGEARDVMARGRLVHFVPETGVYIYRRKLGDKEVVVMMNGKDEPVTMDMTRTLEILPFGTRLTNVLDGSGITIEKSMTFTPRQILILQNW